MRCAVLGRPIAHSLSPALHRAAYAALGLDDWTYDRFDIGADELADFVAGCDGGWRGLSLTRPLKEAALALGDVDPVARLAGGANTLIFGREGRAVHNTDVGGLVDTLVRIGEPEVTSAVILGTGATARSALVSLSQLGCREVTVVARSPEKIAPLQTLAEALDLRLQQRPWSADVPPARLLVSTVTAGAPDDLASALAEKADIVFDIVYDPWPTRLAAAAAAAGRLTLNGLDLLVAQAVRQVAMMTGSEVDPEVLHSAGRAALA